MNPINFKSIYKYQEKIILILNKYQQVFFIFWSQKMNVLLKSVSVFENMRNIIWFNEWKDYLLQRIKELAKTNDSLGISFLETRSSISVSP